MSATKCLKVKADLADGESVIHVLKYMCCM